MVPVVFMPAGAFTSEAAGITALGITDLDITEPGITGPAIIDPAITGTTDPGIMDPGITGITDPASTLAGASMFAVADIMDAAASTPAEVSTGIAPPIAAEAVFMRVEP
jgi:hypothetical protein